MSPDAIAFYLPQYHPIPLNDEHWGKGFTEWNNVVRAKPLFPGHYQPHLPTDLGFYDLRVPDVRAEQRTLAADAGISAFAFYHYWFEGRRLMEGPVDAFFADPESEVKYLLCWANESWTLEWRNKEDITTLEQTYSEADDVAHAELLVGSYFTNPRYYRLDGRPVFLVYHPTELPDAGRMLRTLRSVAKVAGLDPIIGGCVAFGEPADVRDWGLDFSVLWAPNWSLMQQSQDERLTKLMRIQGRLLDKRYPRFRHNEVYDYEKIVTAHLSTQRPAWPTTQTAFPTWDNTARRAHGDALVVRGSTPERFERWLRELTLALRPDDPSLVFVNAWNEWAEGCHLEPDERWGHAWLDACRRVFGSLG